jgi:hypothetical protein
MKQRAAQSILLYAMDLEEHHGPFPIEDAREVFLSAEPWQPTRRFLERLWATRDWGEVIVAANLCFEPAVGTLLRRELGIRAAAASGDTVTPTLARVEAQEWEWARAWTAEFVRFLVEDPSFGPANHSTIRRWLGEWMPQAEEAVSALAPLLPAGTDVSAVRQYVADLLAEAGLSEDVQRQRPRTTGPRRRRVRPRRAARATVAKVDGAYDYVGIVMAKSAEGDAVAEILGRRDDVVVHEQPAFWDIRAEDRLVIPYEDVSEELGYDIDAYSIQHEMSTHYGRMVATDEALMLFSDPTEAMEHLMS